jgi:hypothetical protein
VTMLYKITHNLVAIDPNLYLVKQPIVHTRNSNILQYQLFNTRTQGLILPWICMPIFWFLPVWSASFYAKSLRSY